MKKLNITKGEVFIQYNGHYHEVRGINRLSPYISVFSAKKENHPDLLEEDICEQNEAKANAELIADAFTTYNTTPILPSELLKQRNEFLDGLRKVKKLSDNGEVNKRLEIIWEICNELILKNNTNA
jgi:hypothetical protein